MGGAFNMGQQGGSSQSKAGGNGRMGEGGGMVRTGQGYRSSGVPASVGGSNSREGANVMGGSSSGAPIISEGRRGAMGASGGLVGSFYTGPEDQTKQSWNANQRLGGSQISFPPPGAPMASFPPPGIPPPTSRTDGPPGGFNAGGSSAVGFNIENVSFNQAPTGAAGGYDSSKYGRARNKPS